MLTSMFLKKWRGINHYCEDVLVRTVNIAPIEPQFAFRNSKRSLIEPNSLDIVVKDENAQYERELNEAMM